MSDWGREWRLNSGSNVIVDPSSSTPAFRLVKRDNPGIRCYSVEYEAGDMPETWEDCELYPQGTASFRWDGQKLPAWKSESETGKQYSDRIAENLRFTTADTKRLEGELSADGEMIKVWLFIARNAVNLPGRKGDLLVVRTRSELPWSDAAEAGGVGMIEDGTGHGNSP
jgi:hypothetical protein